MQSALPPIEVAPLAGLPGGQHEPAFSPDGNQVAFVLGGTEKLRDLHDDGRGREVAALDQRL